MLNLPLTHDFTGKVVVVTGAGGVLCGDMARAYAQAGAKVAALDLNEEAVKKLAADLLLKALPASATRPMFWMPRLWKLCIRLFWPTWAPATFWSTVQAATIPVQPATTSTITRLQKA